jgi:Sec-independent protein translocase protein TatA
VIDIHSISGTTILVGAIAYLVLGEKRLGHKFTARSRAIKERYNRWLQPLI